MEQLADARAGVTRPPDRMCDSCYERYKHLHDEYVPCRVDGCDGTWFWFKMAQLQAWLAVGSDEPAKPPSRMCPDSSALYASLRDDLSGQVIGQQNFGQDEQMSLISLQTTYGLAAIHGERKGVD